jgi:hemoglobin
MTPTLARARSFATALALVALLAISAAAQTPAKSLYQRLGGYDAITAVVGEFADRLFADPALARFFGGMNGDAKARFKQLNVLLVCNATGGPCTYIGRTMHDSHVGRGIADSDFDAVAAHLAATLDEFGVPKPERGELLAIIGGLRAQIVGV